jgi:hypothetical protein
MKLFECTHCNNTVHFDNAYCLSCARRLGYHASTFNMVTLVGGPETWHVHNHPGRSYRFCENASHDACNWLVPVDEPHSLCAACRHNLTIPDLHKPENVWQWQKMEMAKKYLFYSLMRWNLPLQTKAEAPETGLSFHFISDTIAPDGSFVKVMTGHDSGTITINLAEADDATREQRRTSMLEPYRTLIGHFRHEIGHYYWDRLVLDGNRLEECRALFGDDRLDYNEALERHYNQGPPENWRDNFISAYATMHPWEDFAETWAHYIHMVDTLETARAYGLSIKQDVSLAAPLEVELDFNPYRAHSIDELVLSWMPLTVAVNAINRSLGQPDLYPFVLSQPVIQKLGFVHRLIHENRLGR